MTSLKFFMDFRAPNRGSFKHAQWGDSCSRPRSYRVLLAQPFMHLSPVTRQHARGLRSDLEPYGAHESLRQVEAAPQNSSHHCSKCSRDRITLCLSLAKLHRCRTNRPGAVLGGNLAQRYSLQGGFYVPIYALQGTSRSYPVIELNRALRVRSRHLGVLAQVLHGFSPSEQRQL
jgi:hypothetical protein